MVYTLVSTKKANQTQFTAASVLCYQESLWVAAKPTTPLFTSSFPFPHFKHRSKREITSLTQLVYVRATVAGFHIMFTQFRQRSNSLVQSRQSNGSQILMGPEWKSSQLKSRQTALISAAHLLNFSTGGALWASRGHSCLTWWSRFTCTAWRWERSATQVTWAEPWHAASHPSSTCPPHTDGSSCCLAVGPNAVLFYTPKNMNPAQ